MTPLRIALLVAALLLSAAIFWASHAAPFFAGFSAVLDNPWGVVTLIDLYAGFLFAGVMIWLIEPNKRLAATLALITLVLGNVVPLVWLSVRGLRFLARQPLSRPA
jgi:cytochrome c oxidase assembly factor CtaG